MASSHSPEQEVLPANLEYLQKHWLSFSHYILSYAVAEKNWEEIERALMYARASRGNSNSQERAYVEYSEEAFNQAIAYYWSIISFQIPEIKGVAVTEVNANELALRELRAYYLWSLGRFPFPEEVATIVAIALEQKIIPYERFSEERERRLAERESISDLNSTTQIDAQILQLPGKRKSNVQVVSAPVQPGPTEKIISFAAHRKRA